MRFFRCGYCQHKAVPEILLATIDLPLELDVVAGESCMVEAHICRPVRAGAAASMAGAADGDNDGERRAAGKAGAKADARLSGEAYAAHISEALPFIHYDVHRQLLYKLSVHGMNAVFGLKYQFSVGADMIIAVATGTAVYVTGLPTPGPLHIKRNIGVVDDEDRGFMRIQDRIMRLSDANRRRLDRAFRKKRRAMLRLRGRRLASSDEEESGSEGGAGWSQRRRSISARVAVQIDDDADEDLMAALLDIPLPPTFAVCNVERPPLFRRFFDNVSVDPATHSPLALSSSSSSSSSEEVSSSSESSSGSEDVEAARKQALQYLRPELIETLVLVKRATVDPYTNHPNRQLAGLFNAIYLELHATLAYFSRCAIAAVDYTVQVVAESPQDVQVTLTATVVGETHNLPARYLVNAHLAPDVRSLCADVSSMHLERSADASSEHRGAAAIELTTLSYLPSRIITAHVGRVSLHFVQEVHIDPASKGPVGMGAFVFSFVAEVQAMARAHVAARGGMAMVALSIDQVQILRDDRSEAYATMSISGDVVRFKRDF
ncbi:hypothetical protein IW150_001803 [Coemansia sp. RSA 2607]|nr:hypothetical protein IW150_001803 [Coemansia sp. RSA 2607]